MPDIADQHSAFREAMARAEAASGIERDAEGNEINGIESIVSGKTPDVLVELEGAVPVAASDQTLTTEPVETATSEEQQVVTATPTVEELIAEREKLLAQVEEQKAMIGRQSSEVGEVRQEIAALREQVTQAQPVTTAPAIPITQELIETNPAAAVQEAFRQRNEPALQLAFEAWKEVDPFTAATWLADRKLEQQNAAFEARLAQQEEAIGRAAANAAKTTESQQWKEAFDEVKATRPDFMENAERLLSEVAPQYPDIANVLATGDGKAKAQALSALYALDKMGNPAAVQQQLAEAAQEAEAEAAAARAAAGAVTGQTTAGQPVVQQTAEELERDAYLQRQKGKPSLARGWTGRS